MGVELAEVELVALQGHRGLIGEGAHFADLLLGALADDGLEAGQLVQHVGRGAVLAQDLVHGHQRHARLLQAQAAVALGEHDLVEAEVAQALDPAQRVLVLLVALEEVLLPGLALHVVAVRLDDQLLVIAQLEIHCFLLSRGPKTTQFLLWPASLKACR